MGQHNSAGAGARPARSIRAQLLLLVLALALPLLGALGYSVYDSARSVRHDASLELRAQVHMLASNAGSGFGRARAVLERIAERPAVQAMDPHHCDSALDELLLLNPGYANIATSDLSGAVVCSAVRSPQGRALSVGGYRWFKEFVRAGSFSVGEPHIGPVSGKWVVVLSAPVRDTLGAMVGGIHLPIDLASLDSRAISQYLPPQTRFGFIERDGTLVWRNTDPDNEKLVGTRPDAEFVRGVLRVQSGEFVARGSDDVERVYAATPVPGSRWIAYAGIPTAGVHEAVVRRAAWSLALAAGAGMVLVGMALLLARRIARPMRQLEDLARRAGAGDRTVRAAMFGPREVQAVAREFNAMLDARGRSEAQLQAFTDNQDVAAWVKDAAGRYVFASKRLLDRMVRRGQTMIGRRDDQLWPLDVAEALVRHDQQVRSTRAPVDVEECVIAADGSVSWWLSHKFLFTDAEGQEFVGGLAVDITQRKRIEDELRANERRYRELFELSADWYWETDRAHRYTSVSRGQSEYQRAVEALDPIGATPWDWHGAQDTAAQWEGLRTRFLRHEAFTDLEIETTCPDGRRFTISLSGKPIFDDDGVLRGYRGVGSDISSRRAAEHDRRVAAIAFDTQEGITITDAQRVILRVNQAFTRITGYSAEEAVGANPRILKSGKHDAAFYEAMSRDLARDGFWSGEIWNRRKDGEIYLEWLTISVVRDQHGEVANYVATFSDITRQREADDTIRQLAFFDPLTSLANRRLFNDRLAHAQVASARSGHYSALMFIDLDNFKALNDTRGHHAGDQLLVTLANRLRACVRAEDTVARLGGDEFVLLINGLAMQGERAAIEAQAIAEKTRAAIGQPIEVGGQRLQFTASAGICLFVGTSVATDELLRRADIAMYDAKRSGRDTARFFDPHTQAAMEARLALQADLHRAVPQRELRLYYQPQLNAEGVVYGAEALVRWQHPARGLVPPGEFIPLAEESGLIVSLGTWVLEEACRQLAQWAQSPATRGLTVSVNVSAPQFAQTEFVGLVCDALRHSGANPARLKLEVTESMVAHDVEDMAAKMGELRALGIRFSLDDFGVGHSSLSQLVRLPIDELKIDQSFVHNAGHGHAAISIIQTIIGMAGNLGLHVVAEGVETPEQRALLEEHGCFSYQGYLYGRPMPAEAFLQALAALTTSGTAAPTPQSSPQPAA